MKFADVSKITWMQHVEALLIDLRAQQRSLNSVEMLSTFDRLP